MVMNQLNNFSGPLKGPILNTLNFIFLLKLRHFFYEQWIKLCEWEMTHLYCGFLINGTPAFGPQRAAAFNGEKKKRNLW